MLRRHITRNVITACVLSFAFSHSVIGQEPLARPTEAHRAEAGAHRLAQRFRNAHRTADNAAPARALLAARAQNAALEAQRAASPQAVSLSAAWQAVGPVQVNTSTYGLITGRVTSLAIDPNDATGNTVYLGSTGGGVWKSTNAAATTNAVRFTPLTDTLPAFSANAGTAAIPSLSIGAVTVQPGGTGVVLAGTGDPNDATDSYYGVGVLRSEDNGVTWALTQTSSNGAGGTHSFTGEGFAGFAWSTASPQLVVAAVSSSVEGSIVQASTSPASVRGLYYSTDAGGTWHIATVRDGATTIQSGNTDYTNFEGNAATAVVWNPVRARFIAAVRYHGYYESTDGITWTRLTAQPGTALTAANCPSRAGTDGLVSCPIFRGALAVQPVSGDVFALTVNAGNNDTGLWQDTCAKTGSACASPTIAWGSKLNSTPLEDAGGSIAQGDYNLTLAAIPAATALSATDTLLFAGTTDIFRCSLAGGCSLRNTTNASNGCAAPAGVFGAQHAVDWQINLSDSARPRIVFGNDGGLWRSLDGVRQLGAVCSSDDATHFDNLNGALGSLAEVVSVASHPADANIVLAAIGGGGSAAATTAAQATGTSPWAQLSSGESAIVAIDQAVGSKWMVQSGAGVNLHTCNNGAACTAADFAGAAAVGIAQVSGDSIPVDPPALLDPALNTNIVLGTCRVWRGPTAGGTSWSSNNSISPSLSGAAAGACSSSNGSIASLAAGGDAVITNATQNSGSPVLYAGISGLRNGGGPSAGHLYANTSANTATSSAAWNDTTGNTVTNDPSTRFNVNSFDISSIAVDRGDATGKTVYATISGFGGPHVYRSVNAGASWTNISANLPNAPANSIAVDPGDRNIVYVAMDTGVYVTSAVASCVSAATGATSNCWSVYGSALPNAPVVSLAASGGFAASGANGSGTLRAGTYGRGIWQIPLLTAGQVATPSAVLSPASLAFASQAVGSTSSSQAITVTNNGSIAVSVASVASSGPFAASDNCSGQMLAPGAACTVQVTFTPTASGAATGTVQVFANVQGGYVSASLTGTGNGTAAVQLSPATLNFAGTNVNAVSAVQTITVSNNGATTTLTAPSVVGDFRITTNRCGTTLAANANCTVDVAFAPTANGTRAGIFAIADSASNHTAALNGAGVAGVLSLSTTTLVFPDLNPGVSSTPQVITVSNTGNGPLTIGAITTTVDYALSDTCHGATIAAAQSCRINVVFTPTAAGARNGSVTVISNTGGNSGTTSTVTLNGNGRSPFNPTLLPTTIDFGAQTVTTTSAVRNITISNTGVTAGAIGTASVTGDYSIKANTCGATLLSNTGCTVSIAFTPASAGVRNGVFTIATEAGDRTATLTGSGTLPPTDTLSATSLSFAAQQVNTLSTAQSVTLINNGDTALTLVAAQVLAGDFTVANGCGTSLAARSSCSLSVVFAPKNVGALTGTLQISDALRVQTITLSGTGLAGPGVSLLPSRLAFANTGVGVAGAAQTMTLTNNGGVPLQLTALNVAGDFGIVAAGNTCSTATALGAGSACSFPVAFIPQAAGPRTGGVTILSNGATQTANLSGTGVDFTFVANGSTAATLGNGESAAFPLLLRPAVASNDAVTYTCSGAPANTRCTITSQYSDLSAVSTVTVTLLTGTTPKAVYWPLSASLILLPIAWRRRRRIAIALLYFGMLAVFASGCGSGRKVAAAGDGSATGTTLITPPGAYTVTASATAAGLTRAVNITLTVK